MGEQPVSAVLANQSADRFLRALHYSPNVRVGWINGTDETVAEVIRDRLCGEDEGQKEWIELVRIVTAVAPFNDRAQAWITNQAQKYAELIERKGDEA